MSMEKSNRSMSSILEEQANLVAELTDINAELLRARQIASAAEIDVLRMEREIDFEGPTPQRTQELTFARSQAEIAHSALQDCERRQADLARKIDAINRQIAGGPTP